MNTDLATQAKTKPRKAPGHKFTEQQRELALITLARWSGNSRKAAAELKKHGLEISTSSLKDWRRGRHREDYLRVQAEVLPEVREAAREEHMQLAAAAMEVEREMIERLKGQVPEITTKEMPGALRNVATTAGIHADKAKDLSLLSAPAERTKDFAGIVREFKQATGIEVEFSVPEEIQDAEVVEG